MKSTSLTVGESSNAYDADSILHVDELSEMRDSVIAEEAADFE